MTATEPDTRIRRRPSTGNAGTVDDTAGVDVAAAGVTAEESSGEPVGDTGSEAAQPARIPTFAAFAVRNYRLFFAGQVVSNTGTWMQRIAQDWLVLSITNSPLAVGITTALQFLPMLLFGLIGGVLADRYPRRTLLIATQAVMGLLAATLAFLTFTGSVQVWQIYLIAFCLGLVTVVDNPTRQTFVNEMVPHRLVRNAVSLNSGNFQLARTVGPAVAGILITVAGAAWAFGINAISYLAVIGGLLLMRPSELQPSPKAARRKGQVREGLAYVRGRPDLLWTMVLVFFIGTFGYNFAIILSAYAKNVFQSGADTFGLLNSAMAIGSVIGALLAARRQTGRMSTQFALAATFGVLLLALGVTPWLVPFVALLVITGMVGVLFNTLANASVQLGTDAELRGRVMSLYMLVFAGGTPIGSVIVGAITNAAGPEVGLLVSGAVVVVATAGAGLMAARQSGRHVADLRESAVAMMHRPRALVRH
jgi:MFS family permease